MELAQLWAAVLFAILNRTGSNEVFMYFTH